jgi:hypothetical protein
LQNFPKTLLRAGKSGMTSVPFRCFFCQFVVCKGN